MKSLRNLAVVAAVSTLGLLAADTASMGDQKFAKEAAMGGMAEVQLGQLAVKNGGSQKVKDFGQKMADDHAKANDELKSIAAKKNMTLPTDVSAKDKALMDRLAKLSGAQFDKAYMSAMVKDHHADIALFEKESNSGSDSDLKSFASSTLPTLKSHLQMATDASGMAGSSK